MQPTIVPGVSCWSQWQPDRNLFFNSWFVRRVAGNFVVDPLADDAALEYIAANGGIVGVVLTNRDHERAAHTFSDRFHAPVVAPARDASEIGVRVDRAYEDGDEIFGWRAVNLDGMKSAGESALFRASDRTAITGDAFWGAPAGSLTLMADDKLLDPERAVLSTRRLLALNVQHLLVGDGAPVFHRAWETLVAMLEARTGVLFRRVNLDELEYDVRKVPDGVGKERAEISWFLGVRRLGYAAARLEPGEHSPTLHGHSLEEELVLVVAGTPTIQTPQGFFVLRPGDLVALPVGAAGAHKFFNESTEPCMWVVFANVAEGDSAFYPDSHKLLVDRYGINKMVRDNPELGYFDGES